MSLVPIDVDKFRAAVKAEIAAETIHVVTGKCTSLEDYKRRTGAIAAFQKTIEHFNMVLKQDDDGPE